MGASISKTTADTGGAAGQVPEGHRRVRWLFNPKRPDLVNQVVDMPADEARMWVRENRVRYEPDAELSRPDDAAAAPETGPAAPPVVDQADAADTSPAEPAGEPAPEPVSGQADDAGKAEPDDTTAAATSTSRRPKSAR